MADAGFTDPVSRRACTLHVAKGWMGVEHPDCDQPANVFPALDGFYCGACGWNGRISGAWAADLYAEAQKGGPC